MKCQNSAKVNGFKRCIDEFVGLKQVKKQRLSICRHGKKNCWKDKKKKENCSEK